jgi:hypothetical protein
MHLTAHRVSNDHPEAKLLQAFKQDAVISSMATVSVEFQKAIIDAAVKASVKGFVLSEFGSNTLDEEALAILPQFFKGKLETVEYLLGKEKEGVARTASVTKPFSNCKLSLSIVASTSAEVFLIWKEG